MSSQTLPLIKVLGSRYAAEDSKLEQIRIENSLKTLADQTSEVSQPNPN